MFCAASPLLYLQLARRLVRTSSGRTRNMFCGRGVALEWKKCLWEASAGDRVSRAAVLYFVLYALVGTVLHTNYFPWT